MTFACPPDHAHAATTVCAAIHGCRCQPCREERARRQAARNKAKAYGRFDLGLVDAEPVREHLHMLSEFGIGWRRAVALAEVSRSTVQAILWGRKDGARKGERVKRVNRETAAAILAVKPDIDNLAAGAHMSARGAHRRVQALACLGWSPSSIGTRVDITPTNFASFMQRARCTVEHHRAIAAVFDELCLTHAPQTTRREKISYSRAVNRAAAARWLPPLAWDDIDFDAEPAVADEGDASDLIDHAVVVLAVEGERPRMTPAERREVVRILHREQWGDPRIAEHTGMVPRTVIRIRQELGLEGIDRDEQAA